MKGIKIFILVFFGFSLQCVAKKKDFFVYEYQIFESVTFDFEKSYSVDLGSVQLMNEENKVKKFRYQYNSPTGYFFNKKTGVIKKLELVLNHSEPEKADSLFWALLGSATYYTPVKPHGSISLKMYLNLNFHPRPREIIEYVDKNWKDLEYHIFNPFLDSVRKNFPDAILKSIQVRPSKKGSSF